MFFSCKILVLSGKINIENCCHILIFYEICLKQYDKRRCSSCNVENNASLTNIMIGPLPVAAEARQSELLGPVDHVVHRLELEHFVVLQSYFFFKYVLKKAFSTLLLNVVVHVQQLKEIMLQTI